MDTDIYRNEIKIQQRIAKVYEEVCKNTDIAYDIGFHMTDWLADIKELHDIYSNIDDLSDDQIRSFVAKFLAHVPNHLNAAMKLSGMGPVTDVFEVGIFEADD